MKPLTSIVAAVDFSENSLQALKQAITLAKWHQASLYVVHVIEDDVARSVLDMGPLNAKDLEDRAYEMIRQTLLKISPDKSISDMVNQIEVKTGIPIELLTEKIKEVNAELVILGVHGSSSEGKEIGAFATKCIRKLPAEVMIVDEAAGKAFKQITVCIDVHHDSSKIIEDAIHFAYRDMARLDFLHIYCGPWNTASYLYPSTDFPVNYIEEYRTSLQHRFDELLRPYTKDLKNLQFNSHLIESLNHGEGIIRFIQENKSDLVVLGTHGKSGLLGFVLGSTAERVLKSASCSILTIKPEGFEE